MATPSASAPGMLHIPIIDFSPWMADEGAGVGDEPTGAQLRVAAQIAQACRETGFLFLTNHVDPALVASAFAASKELFALPEAHKLEQLCPLSAQTNVGYSPVAAEQLNIRRAPDLKECFNTKWPSLGLTDFRGCTEAFRDAAPRLFEAVERFFRRYCIATAIALDLDDRHFFLRAFGRMDSCMMRCLHYPPTAAPSSPLGLECPDGAPSSAIRVGEHTDFGMNTVLFLEAGARGLQVKQAVTGGEIGGAAGGEGGDWREISLPDVPGSILNTGALLARWTNDTWCATAHRVIVPDADSASRPRFAIACFMDPDEDSLIAAHPQCVPPGEKPRYDEITGGEYLQMKLRAAYSRLQATSEGVATSSNL